MNAVAEVLPPGRTVITPENSEAFYVKKLGLEPAVAPEKPVEPAVESAKSKTEEAPETETDAQQTDPEKKQRLNQRFSDLTKARDDEKARADKAEQSAKQARERLEAAERRAAELTTKYEPPKTDPLGPKPKREQFSADVEYETAFEEWNTEKVTRDRVMQETQARVERAWNERQTAFKAVTPDYDAVIAAASNLMVSNKVRDAVLESEQGPQILLALAKDAQLVADMKTRGDDWALRKVGSLEAKFEVTKTEPASEVKAEPAKPAVAATETSRAPAPISRLQTTTAAPEPLVDSSGEFHGTAAQWREARKAGRIK